MEEFACQSIDGRGVK